MNNKLSICLIIALIGFPQISETIYTPSLPNLAKDLYTTNSAAESTLAIYFIGFAWGVFLWGAISDRVGRRFIMLLGLLIYIVFTLACAKVETIELLLICRFFQALGASVGSVITQTMLRDIYDGHQRAKIFSILSGALAFSPAVGPFIGGYISEFFGWRANFWFLGFLGIILIIVAFKFLPETRQPNLQTPSRMQIKTLFSSMFRSSNLWGHILLIAATNGIIFGFYQEAPFVYIEQLGLTASQYGLLGIMIATSTLLASRISYKYISSQGAEGLIRFGSFTALSGGLLFSFVTLYGGFSFNSYGIGFALIGQFIAFCGVGIIIPNSLSLALKPFQYLVGTAGSLFGAAYYVLIAMITFIISLAHTDSLMVLPLVMVILSCVLMIGSGLVVDKSVKKEISK